MPWSPSSTDCLGHGHGREQQLPTDSEPSRPKNFLKGKQPRFGFQLLFFLPSGVASANLRTVQQVAAGEFWSNSVKTTHTPRVTSINTSLHPRRRPLGGCSINLEKLVPIIETQVSYFKNILLNSFFFK